MITVKHRFLDHKINPNTETLIIGTFNPDVLANEADFFYGRQRNYFWRLLAFAFGHSELKGSEKEAQLKFIEMNKIGLIDLIEEVKVELSQEANYDDKYLDKQEIKWREIISEIKKLKNIKRVCFTRKTYSGIPKMRMKMAEIQEYCQMNNIYFKALQTPARFYSLKKQSEWDAFFIHELV